MKMSDEFELPVKPIKSTGKYCYSVEDANEMPICFVMDESEAIAVAHAIKHHDELVETLSILVRDVELEKRGRPYCIGCGFPGIEHEKGCHYTTAVKLLERLK